MFSEIEKWDDEAPVGMGGGVNAFLEGFLEEVLVRVEAEEEEGSPGEAVRWRFCLFDGVRGCGWALEETESRITMRLTAPSTRDMVWAWCYRCGISADCSQRCRASEACEWYRDSRACRCIWLSLTRSSR